MWFKEDKRWVLLQQLTHFGFAVRFTPMTNSLHRHIFFFHFATVDKHFTDTAIGVAVFPGIAKEVKRAAIAKIDVTTALNIHNEVIHQGVAVRQNIIVAQGARINLGTAW